LSDTHALHACAGTTVKMLTGLSCILSCHDNEPNAESLHAYLNALQVEDFE
jgi:hypothetical protein